MGRPSTFRQYRTLLAKDLRQEFRTREMLTSMGIYAFLVIIVYGAALALTAHGLDIMRMGGGLLWVLIVFTSLLGLARSFAHEKEQGCMEGILMVPLDRSVVFLAKTTANFLFMLVVEVIAVPLFYFFFMSAEQVAPTFAWIVAPLFVGTLGMAGIGTMLSTITMNTRAKDVMLAVLFIPLIYPLLYACVTATTAAIARAAARRPPALRASRGMPPFSASKILLFSTAASFLPHGSHIHANDDQHNDRENDCGKCPERRLDGGLGALGGIDDIGTDGVEHRGFGVHRDEIIIQRKGDRQRESGDDAGHDLGDHDLCQRGKGRRAKIQRRLINAGVHLLDLGHD